jgi:hypothetical protein
MKQVCKLFLLSVLFISASLVNAQTAQYPLRVNANISDTISKAANTGLQEYLNKIPLGKESDFGFENRKEFGLAKAGTPYELVTLSKAFMSDKVLNDENYFAATNEWIVPVMVNGEGKTLVTVAKMNGTWKVVDLGGIGLAHELTQFEREHSLPVGYGRILKLQKPKCHFLYTGEIAPGHPPFLFPLTSARLVLAKLHLAESPSSVLSVLSSIKQILSKN